MKRSAPFRRPISLAPVGRLGPVLHRGVTFSKVGAPGRRYLVTEEYVSGYIILSAHPTRAEALEALHALGQEEGKR